MTVDGFRKLALAFPAAVESSHFCHPDFRVGGRIFATLWPAEGYAMVKLTPAQQGEFVKSDPDVFFPVKGAWGARGATHIRLKSAKKAEVHGALTAAWLNTAPKRLIEHHESDDGDE